VIKLLFALIWLGGIAAAFSRRWIRRQSDAWPFVIGWPAVLAYIVAILIFEGFYRLLLLARRRWRRA